MKLLYSLLALLFFFGSECIPIETPDQPERSKFVIKAPSGWAYRTFKGENGLIGALWPQGTSFNDCDTAVFVFIQNFDEVFLPEVPDNGHLFQEKCPKSEFKFADVEDDENETLSIEEKYFNGLCGRTEVMFEEKVKNFRIITVLASSFYVSDDLFEDVKYIVSAYKKEIEDSLGIKKKVKPRRRINRANSFESQSFSETEDTEINVSEQRNAKRNGTRRDIDEDNSPPSVAQRTYSATKRTR